MTDRKDKLPDELGDVNWDQALAEWEANAFASAVAGEADAPPAPDPPAQAAPTRRGEGPPPLPDPLPPPPKLSPPGPKPLVPIVVQGEAGDEDDTTVVARTSQVFPEEARTMPSMRGTGLAQLFEKKIEVDVVDVAAESMSKMEAASGLAAAGLVADESSQVTKAPALLGPGERRFDPDEITSNGQDRDDDIARARRQILSRRYAEEGVAPPIGSRRRAWQQEKAASEWWDDAAREASARRAEWLEEEARAVSDATARARMLLACSEIRAMVGHRQRASVLAAQAREAAPSMALAHVQARGIAQTPQESAERVQALDEEAKLATTAAARAHTALLAADVLHASGDADGAADRIEQAARACPDDVRPVIARAARALALGDMSSPALRPPQDAHLAPLAGAIGQVLRLRGIERKDVAVAAATPNPNEVLLRARHALDKGDVAAAAPLVAELGNVTELGRASMWLAAALGATRGAQRAQAASWLRELVEGGDDDARRALAARAIEMGDKAAIVQAAAGSGPFTSAERATLAALGGVQIAADDSHLDAAAAMPAMGALVAAIGALCVPADGGDRAQHAAQRAQRTAGSPESRALVRLGRLLAWSPANAQIESALGDLAEPRPPTARAMALEAASRDGRARDVCAALQQWRPVGEEQSLGAFAAAIVAERAGDAHLARESFKAARRADPKAEAALRATSESIDVVSEMNALADDLGQGIRAAIVRLEAAACGEATLPDPTRADMLDRAHKAAPELPIASFLAERIARGARDVDEVLRLIRERHAAASDPIEAALDGVREALLVADRDGGLAGARLEEAHRARPGDVALRELYERMATEPPVDRAAWREARAAASKGEARALLYLEAAYEHERAGDEAGALRCAQAAAATDTPLARIARERTEMRTGSVARLAEDLLSVAKSAEDARTRREAYERLADLDEAARHDPASALLWHRSILEETPEHAPSLRHVEHYLVGEGRDEDLEPIASGIARLLRGSGGGECTAHAELAARLRMRGEDGSFGAAREMAELAAAESEPSLWSLRMQQAQARAQRDDEAFFKAATRLVDRASRPGEIASLLVRAGDAALRLQKIDDAHSMFERACTADAGDCLAWQRLAEVRRRAGDARGAAEAYESLARSSLARQHQLAAWFLAGSIWQDEVRDDQRAMTALEAAGAIDAYHADLFDRLSRIYIARKMQPELAALLERRIEKITDPEALVAVEVQRGRVLLEVDDVQGARQAFSAALSVRPDDPGALSSFADVCVSQEDWDAAEQALVRLARLLPTPEEQRGVYARLGELYSHHAINLSRAEVALKEVLKRAPDDLDTMAKLVEVYKRQNDAARAVELQNELIQKARSPEERRARFVELALIHEQTMHDTRRAEQTLEGVRREFPHDVAALCALVEFYHRHRQAPAVNILLDRTSADARRALGAGRFAQEHFDLLAAVFGLRGKKDGARVTGAMADALHGRGGSLRGAGEHAFDPRLDDLLAPDALTPSMRALLAKTGLALDVAAPLDLRAFEAQAMPHDAPAAKMASSLAHAVGLGGLQVFVSPKMGATCVPAGSAPPAIVLGEALVLANEDVRAFLVLRALKLVQARASSFARTPPAELAALVSAWLKCFNPTWQPQGIAPSVLHATAMRVQQALPRNMAPDVGVIALEVAGNLGAQAASLGAAATAWVNRVVLLSLGDANVAIDAIAASSGVRVPEDPAARVEWIARTPQARDVIAFGVSDAFAEARARVGLDR